MDQTEQLLTHKKAYQLTLRSPPSANISTTRSLVRSLLFAELSMISYLPPEQVKIAAKKLGFTKTTFLNNDGSQAYCFNNKADIVIAFRGTEPNEWNDLKADMMLCRLWLKQLVESTEVSKKKWMIYGLN